MVFVRPRRPIGAALLALLITLSAGIGLPPSAAADDETSAVERATQPLRDFDVPGWTILVTDRDGTTRTHLSHGSVDGDPVTGRTPFLMGSIAKSFTATLVARLAHQGRVQLDRPVRAYLPDFTLADGRGHDITVRQLLTHTSGISEADGVTRADRPDEDPDAMQRLVRSLRNATPQAEPGAEHIYSTANYIVLGAMVEQITGEQFGESLARHVLRPLGLSSAVTSPATARAKHLTSGHRYAFGAPRKFDHPYVASGVPYGYLGASAEDLTRFARFHAGTDPAPQILPRESVRALHRPQVRTSPRQHYAMGWRLTQYDGLKEPVLQHTGATPGSFAHVLIDPRSGRTVVLLADTYSESIAPALYGVGPDLLRAANGADPQPQHQDALLSGAVWVAVGVAVLGLLVAATGARALTRPGRGRRWFLGIGAAWSAALALACGLLPRALDLGWRELRLWMLDLAIGVMTAGVLWALAALLLGAALLRRRS